MAERLEQDERRPVFMASRESTPKSDVLASRPTEIELSEVSKEVSSQYRKVLTHLGTPLSKVESLLQNKLGNVEETCFKGLVHWLGRNGEEPYFPATWTILLEAIEKGAERKDYAERLRQKLFGGGDSEVRPELFGTAHLIPIRHPLESKFIGLFEAVQQLLETSKTPPLDDLKQFCKRLFCRDTSTATVDICRATSYQEVVDILYNRSYWMGYNYIEMLISHYKEPLKAIQALVDSYNAELASIVTTRLSEIKNISEPLPDQPQFKGKNLQKIVFRYNLDADGITLESLVHNVKFLSSRLHIQLELLDVLLGSVALVLSLPTERAVQVWSRIEECWRELWKMRVVWIHLEGEHNRSMDLVQKTNAEKIKYISSYDWDFSFWKEELLDAVGFTLYDEYGSQPALKSAVEKYESVRDPLVEQMVSLDWLFHHHVPTESRSLQVDPFAVLRRTLWLAGCDVKRVTAELVINHHLKSPVSRRWELPQKMLGMRHTTGLISDFCMDSGQDISELFRLLPPEWVQLLKDKYLHRFPPGLKESRRQDDKDLSAVLDWLDWHIVNCLHLLKALISCSVKVEQLNQWITDSKISQEYFHGEILQHLESASYSLNEKMSLEKVNEILDSNPIFRPSPIMHVLESEQEDIFASYFQLIANQGGEKAAKRAMYRLRASVPSEYQRDLEEAFQSVVMKRGEGIVLALSTGHQSVPGTSTQGQQSGKHGELRIERLEEDFQLPSRSMKRRGEGIVLSTGHQSVPRSSTQGQQSACSSVLETSTAEDLTEVKRKYQLQVSDAIPWLSRADNADKLKQVLLALTVHSDDPASPLFKETDCECIMNDILQYSAWYESDVLQQVLMKYLARKAYELKTFEQDRRSVLGLISVDKAFPSPLLSFSPLLGYSPMVVHLALSPTWVAMGQVWELKNTICSALHLQPYSLLLRGYSAGSTNLVFYLASSARVTTERVGVVMMSSDVIIHSMVFGCGTQHEVRYHLDQFLSEPPVPGLLPQP